MSRFSHSTQLVLEKAGWFEGRAVEITLVEEDLRTEGFQISDAARKFWQEFGDLRIPANYSKSEYKCELNCEFDRIAIWHELIEPFAKHVGQPLCPIAVDTLTGDTLVIDPNSRVYVTDTSRGLALCGNTVGEAIENFVWGREQFKVILPE